MGPVTYDDRHPEKKKPKQTYHMNLLKAWNKGSAEVPERCWGLESLSPPTHWYSPEDILKKKDDTPCTYVLTSESSILFLSFIFTF